MSDDISSSEDKSPSDSDESMSSKSNDSQKKSKSKKHKKKSSRHKTKRKEKKHEKRKGKKKKRDKDREKCRRKKHKKESKCKPDDNVEVNEDIGPELPLNLPDHSRSFAPMSKEQWEAKQKEVKRVFDEETGRYRLVRGTGEILEEIVSKERHKEINRQATLGDGAYFQSVLAKK